MKHCGIYLLSRVTTFAFFGVFVSLSSADTTYVAKWPDSLPTDGGVTFHPTPEQCRAAGLELIANQPPPPPPTAEQIAAQQAAEAAAASNQQVQAAAWSNQQAAAMAAGAARTNAILSLRKAYRDTTHQFCSVAGLTVADKLDTPAIQTAIQAAGTGPTALPLTQLAFALFVTITDLRRLDGDDAWDRI